MINQNKRKNSEINDSTCSITTERNAKRSKNEEDKNIFIEEYDNTQFSSILIHNIIKRILNMDSLANLVCHL